MRKGRLLFWLISFILCATIIIIYKEKEHQISYDEKTPVYVCCTQKFQEDIKKAIEKSSFGKTNRVVFIDSKQEANFILTDEITKEDEGYKKIAWSPLVVAIDDTTKDKIKSYEDGGYITEDDDVYTIYFDSIIQATIDGKWEDKIFCPKLSTMEGKKFYDFLLINVNNGRYPKEQELQECTEKVNSFLNSNIVIEGDVKDRLKNKGTVKNELYVLFENDVYDIFSQAEAEYDISYPSNTVLYEWYLKYSGENAKDIENIMKHTGFLSSGNRINEILREYYLRTEQFNYDLNYSNLSDSDGFSYVNIPLKEE